LTVKKFIDALIVTARRTSIIMLIFGTAGLLGWFIANQQVAEKMTQAMLSFTDNRYVILALINIFLAIIGCFLSGGAPLIILTPILLPLATSMGIDPLHFGIIMVLNLDMATQTPPVGGTMLLACVVGNARIEQVFRVNKYFLILGFGVVFLVTYLPSLCLYLPSFMK
jgi:TRAP-type C4-dicarboxylate transport system permease large subunit